MKKAFYHLKGEKNHYSTIYGMDATIHAIKIDMKMNQAVLDAIYDDYTGKVTIYSKTITKSDIYGNLD